VAVTADPAALTTPVTVLPTALAVPLTVAPAVLAAPDTVLPTALVTPLVAGTAWPTAVVTAVVVLATVPVTAVAVLATVPAAAVVTLVAVEVTLPVTVETVEPRGPPAGELTVAAWAGAASRRPMPKATARPPVTAPTAYKNTLRAGMHQPFMLVTLIHTQRNCPHPERNQDGIFLTRLGNSPLSTDTSLEAAKMRFPRASA
jgi:hypothetical protein